MKKKVPSGRRRSSRKRARAQTVAGGASCLFRLRETPSIVLYSEGRVVRSSSELRRSKSIVVVISLSIFLFYFWILFEKPRCLERGETRSTAKQCSGARGSNRCKRPWACCRWGLSLSSSLSLSLTHSLCRHLSRNACLSFGDPPSMSVRPALLHLYSERSIDLNPNFKL